MRRLTLALVSCALRLAPATSEAQQRAVTLAEAPQLAERSAPNVVPAQGGVRSAGAGMRAAWGEFLPNLNSSARFDYLRAKAQIEAILGRTL